MKLTLGQFFPILERTVSDCDRNRLLSYINQATETLLHKGPTHYTIGNFRFCFNRNCITWPRQIGVIEGFALCGVPLSIAGSWYEFLGNGPGAIGGGSCAAGSPAPGGGIWCACSSGTVLQRPEAVTFEDLSGSYKLQIQSTLNETGLTRILLQGYDENNQWIRTQDNGVWVDGEYVVLSSTPVLTNNYFSSLVSVIKDESVGTTLVYEYRAPGVVRLLAAYEWDECYPTYRRSYLAALESRDSDGNLQNRSVYVRARLTYYPVKNDNDWLLIGNVQAMKNMVQAIIKYEGEFMDIGQALETKAIQFLNDEERYYNPRSAIRSLNFQKSWGAGQNEIMNLYGT